MGPLAFRTGSDDHGTAMIALNCPEKRTRLYGSRAWL